jgi:hypothetical protein
MAARAPRPSEGAGASLRGRAPEGLMRDAVQQNGKCRPGAQMPAARGLLLAWAAVALLACTPLHAHAQKRFNREYPTQPNVRLHIYNRSGTIEVISWDKNKVSVKATMESRSAKMSPEATDGFVSIDVPRENREDVGDIDFKIHVPVGSSVDISTMSGNITIRNVRGEMVRAVVSTAGDIELTGIRAKSVDVQNKVGNILFDAELLRDGFYELKSLEGDIQIRVTAESGFRLVAVAPRTRNIDLNGFVGRGSFEYYNEKRKVVGKVGEGGALLNTTNGRGSIVFMPR